MPNVLVDSADLFKSRLGNFWMFQDVKYDYTANLAGTGDRSEYDIESYWKVVVVFQERYVHRGSSDPVSVDITDLTCVFVCYNRKYHLLFFWLATDVIKCVSVFIYWSYTTHLRKIEVIDDHQQCISIYNVSATLAFPYLSPHGEKSPLVFRDYKMSHYLLKKQTLSANKLQDSRYKWEYAEDDIHMIHQYARLLERMVSPKLTICGVVIN